MYKNKDVVKAVFERENIEMNKKEKEYIEWTLPLFETYESRVVQFSELNNQINPHIRLEMWRLRKARIQRTAARRVATIDPLPSINIEFSFS